MTEAFLCGRDLQIESLKRDLELLRAELERVKAEVRTAQALVWAWKLPLCVCVRKTVKCIIMYVHKNVDHVLGPSCGMSQVSCEAEVTGVP